MDQKILENRSYDVRVLPSVDDEHGGVMVEIKEPMDPNNFNMLLRCSLSHWKMQEKKAVWVKLLIEFANLIETTVKEGFVYHHAEPHYLMLVYWIPKTFSTIPANATHRVRIGAIIMNDKRELLAVLEKHGRFKGTGVWKIPSGVLEEGEDIFSGAIREVKEETGIDTEFIDVVGFSWMPVSEYAAQPFAKEHSVFKYAADFCLAKVDNGYTGFTPLPISSYFDEHISYLYAKKEDLNL
ncbi:hypothetical protein CASFOL_013883 [Castilleja foliolosa]|uniref:Nudix hydrolase domain-containing protein n=1 Tax=Castilleja foliolosa TaxID=1961234 RepID=A0ABD3DLW0_9LAMI